MSSVIYNIIITHNLCPWTQYPSRFIQFLFSILFIHLWNDEHEYNCIHGLSLLRTTHALFHVNPVTVSSCFTVVSSQALVDACSKEIGASVIVVDMLRIEVGEGIAKWVLCCSLLLLCVEKQTSGNRLIKTWGLVAYQWRNLVCACHTLILVVTMTGIALFVCRLEKNFVSEVAAQVRA